jgi:hypothetical protein
MSARVCRRRHRQAQLKTMSKEARKMLRSNVRGGSLTSNLLGTKVSKTARKSGAK